MSKTTDLLSSLRNVLDPRCLQADLDKIMYGMDVNDSREQKRTLDRKNAKRERNAMKRSYR